MAVKDLLASAESAAASAGAGLSREAEDLRGELRALESEAAARSDSMLIRTPS